MCPYEQQAHLLSDNMEGCGVVVAVASLGAGVAAVKSLAST